MEYIEDYDDECQQLVKKIERLFKNWKEANKGDQSGLLESRRTGIKQLREVCTLFKSDLYLVPRAQEVEYRAKYDLYIEKIGKYETAIKKMELILKDDR